MTPFRAGVILVAGILADCAVIGFLFFANIELTPPASAGSSVTRTIDFGDPNTNATVQAAIDLATSIARGTPVAPPTAAGTATAAASPVPLGQPFTLNGAAYTVSQVVDPEPPGFFTPASGRRFVAVEFAQSAVSAPSDYSIAYLYLRGDDGKDYGWANGNNAPSFGTGHLNPGETARGWITFNVATSVKPVAIVAAPPAGKRTVITTLP